MYIVFFEGHSMGVRYDDPAEMGAAVTEFLDWNPHSNVRINKYV